MAKPIYKIIDSSMDETHYVPYLDQPHMIEAQCLCQPEIFIGTLGYKIEHRPWSATTPEDQ